jgi:hypothetical protein
MQSVKSLENSRAFASVANGPNAGDDHRPDCLVQLCRRLRLFGDKAVIIGCVRMGHEVGCFRLGCPAADAAAILDVKRTGAIERVAFRGSPKPVVGPVSNRPGSPMSSEEGMKEDQQ